MLSLIARFTIDAIRSFAAGTKTRGWAQGQEGSSARIVVPTSRALLMILTSIMVEELQFELSIKNYLYKLN